MATFPQLDQWNETIEENISEISSCFCANCHGNGANATVLPTKIPMFREIFIMTINCPDCSFKNSEVTFGGNIQSNGEKLKLKVTCKGDLNRQLIKSDSASIYIPHLDFEIPATTQRGSISTIEGILLRAANNLDSSQPERLKLGDVDNFYRCRNVIKSLRRIIGHGYPNSEDDDSEGRPIHTPDEQFQSFDIMVDDPAGNSFIENPYAPSIDPYMSIEKYIRTHEQDMALGLQPPADDSNVSLKSVVEIDERTKGKICDNLNENVGNIGKQEVLKFPTQCTTACFADAETSMCVIDIPHFKEVIIMSLRCENCGYKSNEIKGGGAIPKFGTRIELTVNKMEDLAREVLKSDTSSVQIPEIELELCEGGLDGIYTTVEGLIEKMHDRLTLANPFSSGDAAMKQHRTNDGGEFSEPVANVTRYNSFLKTMNELKDGEKIPFTLIISDPLSNSFVGPIPRDAAALSATAQKENSVECYENYDDPDLVITSYVRSHDQDDALGLNDIKTEQYSTNGSVHDSVGIDDINIGKEGDSVDQQEDAHFSTRYKELAMRGLDHPYQVAKAPTTNDTTIMGEQRDACASPASSIQRGGGDKIDK